LLSRRSGSRLDPNLSTGSSVSCPIWLGFLNRNHVLLPNHLDIGHGVGVLLLNVGFPSAKLFFFLWAILALFLPFPFEHIQLCKHPPSTLNLHEGLGISGFSIGYPFLLLRVVHVLSRRLKCNRRQVFCDLWRHGLLRLLLLLPWDSTRNSRV
jgi:hypothetical protein